MITAEEWLTNHKDLSKYDLENHDEGGYLGINDSHLYKIMIEFAKLHVEAALKSIWDKSEEWDNGFNNPIRVIDNDLELIVNIYPLDNIK